MLFDPSSLTPQQMEEILRHLRPEERRQLHDLLGSEPPTLAEFCERTINIKLEPWQIQICNRLEQLRWQKGQRILLHGPPQHGKSIIVSQRLPAYMIGCNPLIRVALACYNQDHAIGFSKVSQQLIRSQEFKAIFPAEGLRIALPAQQNDWSVKARHDVLDAQPSFKALGLNTGFTGRGCDLLIIDDPYADAADAFSVATNNAMRQWWNATVLPRINEQTNVVVMFHRYHDQDFSQFLIEQGGWEFLRYPAIGDDSDEFPDAMNRRDGELLSARYSIDFYRAIEERDPLTWHGQFQGLPRPLKGGYFQHEWFKDNDDPAQSPFIDELPSLETWVRAWDIATGAKKSNDYCVGALMGVKADGTLILADIKRFKAEWAETEDKIISIAADDAEHFGRVYTAIERKGVGDIAWRDLQQAKQFLNSRTPLEGINIPANNDKKMRADAWQSKLRNGYFKMLRGPWNAAFISECLSFHGRPGGRDDQVDAVSLGTQFLADIRGGEPQRDQPTQRDTLAYYRRLGDLSRNDDAHYNPWQESE